MDSFSIRPFAIATLSVNAAGCVIPGDWLAVGSLLLRILGIYILYRNRKEA